MSEKRDYYEVLGVDRACDAATLKAAYRRLAMQFHPDRNPDDREAEGRFKEASEAYQVLSNAEQRARYDRFGHEGAQMGGGHPGFSDMGDVFSAFSDIFGDMFGGGRGQGRGQARGADIETHLSITLLEAAAGVTKEVKLRRREPCVTCKGNGAAPGTSPETCKQCGGRGQVMHAQGFLRIATTCPICRGEGKVIRKRCPTCEGSGVGYTEDKLQVGIPAGVEDGATLRLMGRGEAPPGARPGNLYVALHVEADPRFERDGADLHTQISVSFPQAALGDRVLVPTLTPDPAADADADTVSADKKDTGTNAAGSETEVEIPPGTQPGDLVILRGRGLPRVDGRGTGNLVVHVKLVVPTTLSSDEEDHLRAYAAAGGQRVNAERSGFFKRKKKK
ncbi:MAG: molecular chaperone DnaJ [Deltaproteobacteria bacterium]|nr:molecular chaperone DnaJ [Deltaproteobacteria bacterium]